MHFGLNQSVNVLTLAERDAARSRASRKAPNVDIIMAVCLALYLASTDILLALLARLVFRLTRDASWFKNERELFRIWRDHSGRRCAACLTNSVGRCMFAPSSEHLCLAERMWTFSVALLGRQTMRSRKDGKVGYRNARPSWSN
jgi:hypothetical protein